jgi:hypothetical protein
VLGIFAAAMAALPSTHQVLAEDAAWRVSKSSGDVWVTNAGAQPVALTEKIELKVGDAIHTGKNGRALLVRGEETLLLSPNSAISLPAQPHDGMATTIIQQAGSILLEVKQGTFDTASLSALF